MKMRSFFMAGLFCAASCVSIKAQGVDAKSVSSILSSARQGSIVKLPGFLSTGFNEIEYKKVIQPGPQFIISDDPEYIKEPEAIVLEEHVQPGSVRLYVYNVNGVIEPNKMDRKITAVIKNQGKENMSVRMLKYSSQPPSANYFQIGKQGLADFFNSEVTGEVRIVKPGEAIPIDKQLEKNIVKYDELVHGFYQFVVDQPASVYVLQTSPGEKGEAALKRIKKLIPTSHMNAGRGLFPVCNYKITNPGHVVDTKSGVAQLIIADGNNDKWIQGTVGSAKEYAENAGNYGVFYDINLKWKSTDGRGLALVTWNPRSADNKWCGAMAATMVLHSGKYKQGTIQLPSDELVTKSDPEAVLIQVFEPGKSGEEQEIKFTYSPPGASCLPTPLVLIPIDLNK
ncbi:copper amine oxidase [Pararcticibacter amylolyticus]|uniref:Copper amine oxidase n=1 Tax=Pararcticibacter amylolyticus TaxID=2173175 RepID=A0A2U2PK26_9SPHI|nr:copper amine oxidase [Pararcticibacter amylolyticus]PWG81756.1 copper amine oxidase [Pararcticibacter amylolyticus]